jgi:hypothetical protein
VTYGAGDRVGTGGLPLPDGRGTTERDGTAGRLLAEGRGGGAEPEGTGGRALPDGRGGRTEILGNGRGVKLGRGTREGNFGSSAS